MQFTTTSLLALCATILPVIASDAHSNLHRRVHSREISKRAINVNSNIALLPPKANFVDAVEGNIPSMPFKNILVNNYTQPATIVFWSDMGFAVPQTAYNSNPATPNLIVELPAGATKTVSFSNNYSGAYAAIWPSTKVSMAGAVDESWVELTTQPSGQWGQQSTVDASFITNMASKYLSVETTTGCVSDYTACSFKCNDGSARCMAAGVAELLKCQGEHNFNDGGGNGPWNGGCIISPTFTTTFGGPAVQ